MDAIPPDVRDHLRGREPHVVALYKRFEQLVRSCGPSECVATKTAITFRGSRRLFAGARLGRNSLMVFLDQRDPVRDPRALRSAPHTSSVYVNHFRLSRAEEMDATFLRWIREAYEVGATGSRTTSRSSLPDRPLALEPEVRSEGRGPDRQVTGTKNRSLD